MITDTARPSAPWTLVTGASSGIGLACARRLAQAGRPLVLVARGAESLQVLAAELRARHGVEVRVVTTDLGAPEAVRTLSEATAALDIGDVIAAAGFGSHGPLLDQPREQELGMVDLNVRAVLDTALTFGPRLRRRGGGNLVLFGSIVGFQGVPLSANYAATKAYVQSLAEALAIELAPQGVCVLCAAPGPVHTGFARRAGMRLGAADSAERVAADIVSALGRSGTLRPGPRGRLLSWALATAPRFLRTRILHGVMRGMASS